MKTLKKAVLEPAEWTGYNYRFTRDEFGELLTTSFVVENLFGFQSLPSRRMAVINMEIANLLERMIRALPASYLIGEILLAKCRKRI